MKYMLVIQICSAIYQQCSDPYPNFQYYDSFHDCSTAGYLNALTINQELGKIEVNAGKIMINLNVRKYQRPNMKIKLTKPQYEVSSSAKDLEC